MASMRCSLEVRVPLLDREVIDLSLRIDPFDCLRNGTRKAPLRDLLARAVPPRVDPQGEARLRRARSATGSAVRSGGSSRRRSSRESSIPRGSSTAPRCAATGRAIISGERDRKWGLWTLMALQWWARGPGKGRGVTTPPVPILFTIPNFTTAGSGQALLQIVRRLDRARFAPAIAVLKRGGHLEEEIERLGVPYVEAEFTVAPRPLWSLVRRARRAAAPFRGRGFVLWHSFHYLDDYTEPLVARFAGARAWVYTKKNMSWNRRSWLLRSSSRVESRRRTRTCCATSSARRWLRRRARLLPRGVDIARFHPETAAAPESPAANGRCRRRRS